MKVDDQVSPFCTPITEWGLLNSTLLDYMITIFRIVLPAWIAGIQAPWMDLSSPSMALDTRFPAGMTSLRINLTK